MRSSPVISWGMLALWSALLLSLQLVLVYRMHPHGAGAGTWMPDWTVALAVALAVRVPRAQILPVVLVLALVRVAFSTDPPVAIFAAFLGVSLFVNGLRVAVDVSGLLPRTTIAFVCALVLGVWGPVVQFARGHTLLGGSLGGAELVQFMGDAVPAACVTCLIVGLFGVFLARLPGFSPLYQRVRF